MQKRLVSVDVLRAVAALAVLFAHQPITAQSLRGESRFWILLPHTYGGVGLPLFIVLSGFCIHLSSAKNGTRLPGSGVNWVRFWRRRFWRLYPTYVVALFVSVLIESALTGRMMLGGASAMPSLPIDVATHLCLIHNLFKDYCTGVGNLPLWSLGLEEQLYALYFLFLLIRVRTGLLAVLSVTLTVGVVWVIGLRVVLGIRFWSHGPALGQDPWALGHWMQWPFGWWFLWALGAVAAEIHSRNGRVARIWASPLTCAVFFAAGVCFSEQFLRQVMKAPEPMAVSGLAEFMFGVSSFSLLNWLLKVEYAGGFSGRWSLALAKLGTMSYSIYLIHMPIIFLTMHLVGSASGWQSIILRLFGGFCGSIAAGVALHLLVERRFLSRTA